MTIMHIPEKSYGILQKNQAADPLDVVAEEVKAQGFSIIDSGYTPAQLEAISVEFERVRSQYIELHGEAALRNANEFYTVRAPLTQGSKVFLDLAFNRNLLALLGKLISGKCILSQQNGVINPPQESYNQAAWHRDLPYQHFVSTDPLAINALFCVDDFVIENGATYVLPASHKSPAFPSEPYVKKNAVQIEAKAGSYIVLDCMLFHAGGFNSSTRERRAVNHLYTIPYFKQQINFQMAMDHATLSAEAKDLLGFAYVEHGSIGEYLSTRIEKAY